MRPLLLLAAALLTLPAVAQSDPDTPLAVSDTTAVVADATPVDAALIGEWTLEEVAEAGRLGALGVEVEAMTCAFDAEGTAHVEMGMIQDLDPLTKARTFAYDTADGRIMVEGDDPVRYQILEDGRLEIATTDGLVVRLVRQ